MAAQSLRMLSNNFVYAVSLCFCCCITVEILSTGPCSPLINRVGYRFGKGLVLVWYQFGTKPILRDGFK